MNLDNFEQKINPKVVRRGYDYFLDDLVDGPELIEEDVWLATVYDGTKSYHVKIQTDQQNKQTIIDWRCDCPYDYGPVCKHVVAALYAMTERAPSEPSNGNKKTTTNDKIQEIFNNTTQEDLQEFTKDCLRSVDGFKNRFLAHFADRLDEDPDRQYRSIIRNYTKAAQDRHGFIDYHSAPTVTRPLRELNQRANELKDAGKTLESIALCQVLIEEVTVVIQYMDDSDGRAGDVVMMAFDTLSSIAEDASSEISEKLFYWCLQEFPQQKYHNFGFDSDFLELLPHLVSNHEQEKQFFALIDRQIEREKENRWSDYGITRLIKAKIAYLREQKRDQEVQELLEKHIRVADFRKLLVDKALENKAFEKAKKLCREGIRIAKENSHRGIVIRWQEQLFQIAKLENEVPAMRKWAETLFLKSSGAMQWYCALKATYSKQEWPEKCEELINRIKDPDQRGGYRKINTLAQIFAEEGYTDRLLKLVQLNAGNLSFVDHYVGILQKEYPYELLDLYEQGITKQAKQTGRKQYRQVAGWLSKMKRTTGGDEKAYDLYKNLLRQYNNRPAMKDEFEKAFPAWNE